MSEAVVAREVRVTGHVQGVFFRDGCRRKAGELGVTGWVRNEPDGSVRGHFEGDVEAVEGLIAWCHDGSRRARVEDVEVSEVEQTGAEGFRKG